MTYEMYRYVFLGGAVACGLLFVISAVLFFALRIPKVVSDLTGRTARKAIENIRLQNEQSGDKTYQSSAVNLERGKLTDKISQSGRLVPRDETPFGTGVITEKIGTQQLVEAAAADQTTLLQDETTPKKSYSTICNVNCRISACVLIAGQKSGRVFAVTSCMRN